MTKSRGIHVGIIPDGSRRWAKRNGIKNYDGAQSGEAVDKILTHIYTKCSNVDEVSIWALSTENVGRDAKSRKLVYNLILSKLGDIFDNPLIVNTVKVNIVGSALKDVPKSIRNAAENVVKKSSSGKKKKKTLNICIGYGGKQEILDAVMASSRWLRKNPAIAKIHENVFENFLTVPRPLDMVIRTGGEKRLSGFMLYQIEYAELFFTDTLWPDFTVKEFDRIMEEFRKRERRFGK